MRWTSLTWAACVLSALTGCGTVSRVAHCASGGTTNDTGLVQARRGAEAELRRDARGAWDGLLARHPGRPFSDEFRDGFVDGYAEFRDRGAACQPPPVPPVPYARYKKFFGRGGNDLVRDYYLGFQHGADVAAAPHMPPANEPPPAYSPKPPDMTAPKPPETGKFGEPKKSSDSPLLPPPGSGNGAVRSVPPLPKPELPVIKPFNPDLAGGGKFAPVPSSPDRVPAPFPPLPVSEAPVVPPEEPKSTLPPILAPPPIPTPARTPLLLDNIPVVPLRELPK